MKKGLFLFTCILFSSLVYADSYSGASKTEFLVLRAPVWVFLEAQPGTMKEGEGEKFLPPVQALRELAAFIMSGMSYGWQFSYTPYDKKRNVTENFELVPISAVSPKTKRLRLMEPQVRYPYLYCWSEYTLFEDEARRREHWMSISFATVQGSGNGERKKELSGVYDAYKNAALQAVRNYVRKREKNKPKEIIGEMIIRENPRLFVDSGKFTAEIRVNIYIKEIIPYTIF